MYSLAQHRNISVGDTYLRVAEAGSGPALVFFHGLGWTHALWAPAFDRYAARYRVIAGDTRGHGDRASPPVRIRSRSSPRTGRACSTRSRCARRSSWAFRRAG